MSLCCGSLTSSFYNTRDMKEQKVDFIQDKDVLGQDKKGLSSLPKKKPKVELDHSEAFDFPSLKTRYFTLLIDVACIVLITLGVLYLFEQIGDVDAYLRGLFFVVVIFLYEPVLISVACTPGQYINGIRVRQFKQPEERITFVSAFLRIVCKSLLGWLSFLTISFNPNKRAIHDLASGSIVVELKE